MTIRRGSRLRRFTLPLLVILVLLTVSFGGCAGVSAAPHATLNKVTGQVSLQKAGTDTWVSVSAGTSLQVGDRIRTGTESIAVIIFFEGSVAELQADTEIQLEEMRKEGSSTSVKIREEIGTTSSRVEKLIDARSKYEVETPAGSALVRGSVMGVIVMRDGTTIVDAIKGQCWAVAQGVEVLLTEGTRSVIYKNYAPTGAASPSVAVTNPAIGANTGGQAPAFFSIEPYEEKKAECRRTPGVATVGCELIEVSGEETCTYLLRLKGTLLNMCPNRPVEVSFEWGTASGEYSYETEPQLLTETGDFSFDVDLYSYISGDILELDYYFRAKADGGANGIGYGMEEVCLCQMIPEVITTGYEEIYSGGDVPMLEYVRLQGSLLNMCPNRSVEVSFEWGFVEGVYDFQTTSQSMNGPGDFSFDLTPDEIYSNYESGGEQYDYPPVVHFRAKVVSSNGTGYGYENTYEVPW